MNARLSKVKELLSKQHLDAVLISSVPNIIFLTGFSSFSSFEREAFLLITKDKQYVITDGRYSEAVESKIKGFKLQEIALKSPFETVIKDIIQKHQIKIVGIEENNLTVSEYIKLKKYFKNLKNFNLNSQRIIKDTDELKIIEKACNLGDKAFEYILGQIKPGISEKELAFKFECFVKERNADLSFKPIFAFSKNSSVPHHETGNTKLNKKDIILMDFGVKIDNYCSDMTRTVFIGKANEEEKKIYKTVLEAQKKAIDFLNSNPSKEGKDVDKVVRDYIMSFGYPNIPHSTGHGIGLEVHEAPRLSLKSKDILKQNMVFSIEPGIYIPSKFGIRIEDLVTLDKNSPKILTHSPKTIIEL